jgi:amino acid transporter
MKIKRNFITPFLSLVFLVVGISGLLILLHLFDGYTEVVHEILGLFFLICAIFHIILNWNALKFHFKKGVFLPALCAVLTLSVVLIVLESMHPPVDLQIMDRIVKAPVKDAFRALNVDYDITKVKLARIGVSIDQAQTLEDLWINSDVGAEEVIDLILEKD